MGPGFSRKQLAVLDMLRKGLLAKQIADEMGVSQRTVEIHMQKIRKEARKHGLRYGRVLVDSEGRIVEPAFSDRRGRPFLRQHGWPPRMTPRKRQFLEELAQNGIGHRGKGPMGCQCMRLGWTEWARDESGQIIGEQITEAGREALRQAQGGE